jgi:hypothetical protein
MSFITEIAVQHRNRNYLLGDLGESALGFNAGVAGTFMALSNGNRVAQGVVGGATYVAANSETLHTLAAGGKYYCEVGYNGGTKFGTNIPPAIGMGIANSTAGANTVQVPYVMKGAFGFSGAARPECFPGDIINYAVDFTANKVWIGLNGAWVNGGDPALGTLPDGSGLLGAGSWRIIVIGNQAGVAATYNFTAYFGASQFAYPAPAGFSPWG